VSDAGTATHAADYTQRAGDPTVIRLNAVEVVNAAWADAVSPNVH